jgi:hypothetical protein
LHHGLLDEPTAAAISVYHGMKDPPSGVLVFDFGDETLDISLLQPTGTTFSVVSFGGDHFLGGCDIDQGLSDLIFNRILNEGGVVNVADDRLLAELKHEGEAATRVLCSAVHASYSCHLSAPRADGSVFDLDVELTQPDFSEVLAPIERRVRELLDDYFKMQSLRPESITDVLMVGSTSAVPAFQQLLREVFESDGVRRVHLASAPAEAVAKGAALFAKMILGIRCVCGRDNNLDATVCVACGEPLQSVTVPDLRRVSMELARTSGADFPKMRGANAKVFVSAKSSDYHEAKQVYDFLSARGLDVFFSDRSLPALGDSDYRDVIDHALDESEHMVVVTSSRQNVESPWVKAEWGFFINEKRSNRKTGNLITVVSRGLKPSDLPPSLRYYEVLECKQTGFERLIRYLKSADTK